MRRNYSTINDLRDHLVETMDLEPEAVRNALTANRDLWGRYEEITPAQYAAISRAVYEQVTGGDYPSDWAQRDAERIAEEADEQTLADLYDADEETEATS